MWASKRFIYMYIYYAIFLIEWLVMYMYMSQQPMYCIRYKGVLEKHHKFDMAKLTVSSIEDICFFEVNTKYISSSELKTSEFSRVRSTSENFYVFNSRDEIYLVFTVKKQIFFLFYTILGHFPIHKAGGETKIILVPHCSLRSN